MSVNVGFTGSRNGTTADQYKAMRQEIGRAWRGDFQPKFHHGGCTGADLEAHAAAWSMGYGIVLHPPTDTKLRAWVERSDLWDVDTDVVLPELPYLERNLAIVKAVDLLIVVPNGPYRMRSGTWWTFSAAKREGVPTVVVMPDGSVA